MFPPRDDFSGPANPFGSQFNGGNLGNKPPEWLMGASAEEGESDQNESYGGDLQPVDDCNRILNVGLHFFEGLKDI